MTGTQDIDMETQTQPNTGRLVLLLIAGIPLTMILAASWLWFFVVRGDLDLVGMIGTANQGALLDPPRQITDVDLYGRDGRIAEWGATDGEARWIMLVPSPGSACDLACEQRLYLTRQIHVAMGKEFNRLARAYVSDTPIAETALTVNTLEDGGDLPDSLAALLDRDHRGLKDYAISAEDFSALFPELAENPDIWYLVDPAGWVMMSYDKSVGYRDVMSDLKFLLKNSGG